MFMLLRTAHAAKFIVDDELGVPTTGSRDLYEKTHTYRRSLLRRGGDDDGILR